MWLEADAVIRQASDGQRSLDDFCQLFFGPHAPSTPYSLDDVVSGLNQVVAYDWRSFLRDHLDSRVAQPPLAGIERSGWKLVYTDQKSELIRDMEQVHKVDLLWPEWQTWKFTDLRYSIGLLLHEDGTVLDSAPAMSAYNAGIMPGMRVTQVNGVKFSPAVIEEAVRQTRNSGQLEMQVANGRAIESLRIDYHDGLKYPHLQRDAAKPDLLRVIVESRTASTPVR
jgi:predicted metalloprotease with PDZ domain